MERENWQGCGSRGTEEVATWILLLHAVFKNKLKRFPDKIQSLLFLKNWMGPVHTLNSSWVEAACPGQCTRLLEAQISNEVHFVLAPG